MSWFASLFTCVLVAASFQLTSQPEPSSRPSRQQNVNQSADAQTAVRTVQISVDADADVQIEDATRRRLGVDFKTKQFVNEIPDTRRLEGEGPLTFVLPFDKAGKPYTVMLMGKAKSSAVANLSMTGPGFVVGVRRLNLTPGQVDIVRLAADGTLVAISPSRDGPTPQVFLTCQSDRTTPSYRFEVAAASLSRGKILTVELNLEGGLLNFKSTEVKLGRLTVTMRRTNPSGSRDTYNHRDIPLDSGNAYWMDFGKWDGKSGISFCRRLSIDEGRCDVVKNEDPAHQPN